MIEGIAVGTLATLWTMLSGDNPTSKAFGRLIDMFGEQMGFRLQTANNTIRAKVDAEVRILEVRTEITINTLRASASNEAQIDSIYSLDSRAIARETVASRRKQRNFEQIVLKAAIELKAAPADTTCKDGTVDADWTTQFFNYAQDIGSDELQQLWAKLLVSELKRPGMISRRTLDVVKTLTRENCETFTTLCSYVWRCNNIRETLVIINTDWIGQSGSPVGIPLTDLLLLMDCGLVENCKRSRPPCALGGCLQG